MHWLHRFPLYILLFAFFSSPIRAATDLHDAAARYQAFAAGQREDYAAVGAEYRAAMLAAPDDIPLAIAHCQFLENFIYADDINWNEAAETDLDHCRGLLARQWPAAPEVRLYQLENGLEADALAAARKAWKDSGQWPQSMRARVAAELRALLEDEDPDEAGRYAVIAVELGNAKPLAAAIDYLAGRNQQARAIRLAQSTPPATDVWQAKLRIDALGKLRDKSAARREMDRTIAAGVEIAADDRVHVYLAAGDLAAANRAAKSLSENDGEQAAARFQLALANNRLAEAAGFVSLDDDFDTWVERYSKVAPRAPPLMLSASLLPVTLALLLMFVALAMVPGLLLVPVHYRGLVRRIKDRQPSPLFEQIGLRHAWIGGIVVLLVPTLVACVMRPDLVAALFKGKDLISSQFDIAAIGTLASLVALLPLLPRLMQIRLAPQHSAWRTLGVVVLCWLAVFAVGFLTAQFHQWLGSGDTSTEQTRSVEALVRSSWTDHGLFWTMMLIAIAVPILEEVVFRGLLLGGMSRHISFGWANSLQALLFASIHDDSPRFMLYLSMGLLGGWLVRRYGRLWPAITLHALNNAIVTWLLVT